jgi:hypothetical protein
MGKLLILDTEQWAGLDQNIRPNDFDGQHRRIDEAIERARELIDQGVTLSVVIISSGIVMAMVRWNLAVNADPPIEVARFADTACLC